MAAELLTDASRATDANGDPLPGATWTFYASGTTTLQAVYTTADLDTPHTNPVVADAGGRFPPIYFDSGLLYRGVLETAAGVPVEDIDPINDAAETLFNQPSTGAFWDGWNTGTFPSPPDLDAKVQRFNDRLFIGAATETSGDFPATDKDYYEQFEADHTHQFGFRTSWAQFASGATNGGIAVLGFARSSDSDLAGLQLGMGGCFAAINDNTVNQQHICGLYAVAFREPGTGQTVTGTGTIGGEVDVCNMGNSVQITPGNLYPNTGFTTAWQVNSGAYVDEATTASAGITIGNNKADFYAGIVIAQNAIAGITLDGDGKATAGGGSAIRLGAFQQIDWWVYPFSAPAFKVSSQQLTPANAQSIIAKDTGIEFGGEATAGLAFQSVYPGGATGAWLTLTPAFGSNPPTIGVTGGGANQNLRLQAKGAGTVSFGSYVATPGTITGYITIADAGGTPRKIAITT